MDDDKTTTITFFSEEVELATAAVERWMAELGDEEQTLFNWLTNVHERLTCNSLVVGND